MHKIKLVKIYFLKVCLLFKRLIYTMLFFAVLIVRNRVLLLNGFALFWRFVMILNIYETKIIIYLSIKSLNLVK